MPEPLKFVGRQTDPGNLTRLELPAALAGIVRCPGLIGRRGHSEPQLVGLRRPIFASRFE